MHCKGVQCSKSAEQTAFALYLQNLIETTKSYYAVDAVYYTINWAHYLVGIASYSENAIVKSLREGKLVKSKSSHSLIAIDRHISYSIFREHLKSDLFGIVDDPSKFGSHSLRSVLLEQQTQVLKNVSF